MRVFGGSLGYRRETSSERTRISPSPPGPKFLARAEFLCSKCNTIVVNTNKIRTTPAGAARPRYECDAWLRTARSRREQMHRIAPVKYKAQPVNGIYST